MTELMMRTRFDPTLLMGWVDQALLSEQAGRQIELLRSAHLDTATLLARLGTTPAGRGHILKVVGEALSITDSPPRCALTDGLLENLLTGLQGRLNLSYLLATEGGGGAIDLTRFSSGDRALGWSAEESARLALDRPGLARPGADPEPVALPRAGPTRVADAPSAARVFALAGDADGIDFALARAAGYRGVFQCLDAASINAGVALQAQAARRAGLLWGLCYRLGSTDPRPFLERLLPRMPPDGQTLLALEPREQSADDVMHRTLFLARHWRQRSGAWPGLIVAGEQLDRFGTDNDLARCWLWLSRDSDAVPSRLSTMAWSLRTLGSDTGTGSGVGNVGDAYPVPIPGIGTASVAVFNGDVDALARFWTGQPRR